MGRSVVRVVGALTIVLAVAGCGGPAGAPGGTAPPVDEPVTASSTAPLSASEPPPVSVLGADGPLDLVPWTSCWGDEDGGVCADGAPPDEPLDVGDVEEVAATFPRPGWEFRAQFTPVDQECARTQDVELPSTGDQQHLVRPAGPAGTYDVHLFGHGEGNSVATTFRWTTRVDGPMPVPHSSLHVLAEEDGRITSYGVELLVDDLAATPAEAVATVTVTSAEGRALTVTTTRAEGDCREEGALLFDGPDASGLEAAALGSPPFTYDVELRPPRLGHAGPVTDHLAPPTDAAEWDERYAGADRVWSGDPNGALVAEVAHLAPGRALDVGCGEGADAVWLARRGWAVTALDVSAVALARAEAAARAAGAEVAWVHSGLVGAPLPPGGFDLVSAQYPALLRTPGADAERALLAAVAPGGTLLVVHHEPDAARAAAHGFDLSLYVGPEQVREALDDAWSVDVDERRERHVTAGAGAGHTHDLVLRATRRR